MTDNSYDIRQKKGDAPPYAPDPFAIDGYGARTAEPVFDFSTPPSTRPRGQRAADPRRAPRRRIKPQPKQNRSGKKTIVAVLAFAAVAGGLVVATALHFGSTNQTVKAPEADGIETVDVNKAPPTIRIITPRIIPTVRDSGQTILEKAPDEPGWRNHPLARKAPERRGALPEGATLVRTISFTGDSQAALDANLTAGLADAQRRREAEALQRAETERDRIQAALLAEAAANSKVTDIPGAENLTQAQLEALPHCQTGYNGGSIDVKAFRSQREMKALGLTLDTVLAVHLTDKDDPKSACQITVRDAFGDKDIHRLPHNKEFLQMWRVALAKNGFKRTSYASHNLNRGLLYTPAEVRRKESGNFDATISWGTNAMGNDDIREYMREKKPLPDEEKPARRNGNIKYGAYGAYGLMLQNVIEHRDDRHFNPFDPAHASQMVRKKILSDQRALTRRYGRRITKGYVMAAYNGGRGAIYAALKKCPKRLTHSCFYNEQTANYALGRQPKDAPPKTIVASTGGLALGSIFSGLFGSSEPSETRTATRGRSARNPKSAFTQN